MFKFPVLSTAALGLAAAMAAAPPAAAQPTVSEVTVRARPQPNVEIRRKVVNFRDLNINTSEGGQALLGRIRQASEEVCTPVADMKNIPDFRDYERCKTEAIQGALGQVNSPALSTLYSRVR
ncbi:UrcA family protein [Phenylobacterium sp. LjRoot225]|uniref:UrcA family protein n=1 Tax=Phenylobacterium sp. LjRoot225 TaxID=3342285 RepID=UPI003ECCED5E